VLGRLVGVFESDAHRLGIDGLADTASQQATRPASIVFCWRLNM
jgi:hypothetical protein